jgi:hypothetical protein
MCLASDARLLCRAESQTPQPTRGQFVVTIPTGRHADDRSHTAEHLGPFRTAVAAGGSSVTGTMVEFQGQSWGQSFSLNPLLAVYLQRR